MPQALSVESEELRQLKRDLYAEPTRQAVRQWESDRQRYAESDDPGSPWYEDLSGPIRAARNAREQLAQLGHQEIVAEHDRIRAL